MKLLVAFLLAVVAARATTLTFTSGQTRTFTVLYTVSFEDVNPSFRNTYSRYDLYDSSNHIVATISLSNAAGTTTDNQNYTLNFSLSPGVGTYNLVYSDGISSGWGLTSSMYSFAETTPQATPVYQLNISYSGSGTVTGAGTYNGGDTATITATPSNGWQVSNWSGDIRASSTSTTAETKTLSIDSDKSVIVTFTMLQNTTDTPPTISWTSTPGTVQSDQAYTISAHAASTNSPANLTQITILKNNASFASVPSTGGDTLDASGTSSDTGPQTVTYTAYATDGSGATSATISQTVTISAPNHAPTIAWTSDPSTAQSGQSYTIAAHATDQDGNLSAVTIWKNGAAFASGGAGTGNTSDASGSATDTGSQTITYTAQATDASGATSSTITATVQITGGNAAPTISWTSTPGTVASDSGYTIAAQGQDSDGNLSQVTILRSGSPFSTAGGGDGSTSTAAGTTTDTGPQTITYTAYAADSAGATSSTISQTVTIQAPSDAPTTTISASPASGTTPLTSTITWSASNADTVAVTGSGLSSTDATGSAAVTLTTGSYTYTITATKNGTTASSSATVTVNPRTYTLRVRAGQGGYAYGSGTYNEGTVVTITSSPNTGYSAAGFSGDATGTGNTINVTMDANKTVTALFTAAQYSLVTSASPSGAGTVTGAGTYAYGATAAISAAATDGYVFDHFQSSASSPASPTSPSTTITMTADTTVIAVFRSTAPTTYTLTVSTSGSGTTSPSGTTTYNANDVATVTATPAANNAFNGFIGDVTSSSSTINVVMNANKAVTAVFGAKQPQTISFANPGTHTVSATPFAVVASSSSGLPVTLIVTSGPAALSGSPGAYQLTVTGAGSITLQATQAGDSTYLAATPVAQTFNGVAPRVRINQHTDGLDIRTGTHDDNPTIRGNAQ